MFQALTHIGLTGLWVLPVIGARTNVYLGFMAVSGVLHALLSYLFYFDWTQHVFVIDGGHIGFLSWTVPTLIGALACDLVRARGPRKALAPMALWAVVLMVLGYAISCVTAVRHTLSGTVSSGLWKWIVEPPFFAPARPIDMWTMNQLAGSLSYMVFAAGFSLIVYVLFAMACDVGSLKAGVFRTLGSNALFAYIAHYLVMETVTPFVPRDAPLWYALFGFGVFFGITYVFVRHLEKNNIYIRL
jgi:hypothetical protein